MYLGSEECVKQGKDRLSFDQEIEDLEPYDILDGVWGQDAQGDSIKMEKIKNEREKRKKSTSSYTPRWWEAEGHWLKHLDRCPRHSMQNR